MDLKLASLYPLANPSAYKVHLACWNGEVQPLDVFVRSREEWSYWNRWRSKRNDFSRAFIFSLIDFYPQQHRWLFGGAYRVVARRKKNYAHSYDIELLPESEPYIGRLKLELKRPGRVKAVNFENHYSNLVVSEIFAQPYTGGAFAGYDNIDMHFPMLENLIMRQQLDWKTALANAKGVYMITDSSNGKRYIGSAYGETGIWSRWQCYILTGHGYNDELTKLISALGRDHSRKKLPLHPFGMLSDEDYRRGRDPKRRLLEERAPLPSARIWLQQKLTRKSHPGRLRPQRGRLRKLNPAISADARIHLKMGLSANLERKQNSRLQSRCGVRLTRGLRLRVAPELCPHGGMLEMFSVSGKRS